MTDIERDDTSTSKRRTRSRSRIRRVKSGEEKPVGSRLKRIIRGMGRKSSRSITDAASVASTSQAAFTNVSVLPPDVPKTAEIPLDKPQPESAADTATLELVLLLLDPAARRFELLQLEFDSLRARVVDIIAQIPVSVTEEAIRNQKYEGVISEKCELMDPTVRLVDFCKGKQVLVALPSELTVKDCVRLARPILSNPQVLEMLTNGGFDVSKWKKKEGPPTPTPVAKSKSKSRENPVASIQRTVPPETQFNGDASTEGKSGVNVFPFIAVMAILAIILQAIHMYLATPIQVGVPLPPGTKRSKCGLFGYLPSPISTSCTNSYLEVNTDGTISVFDADRELDMLIVGSVCSKDDCIDGLVMQADGSVLVGGKRVKSIIAYGSSTTITPWPFAIAPKLTVKKFTLNK